MHSSTWDFAHQVLNQPAPVSSHISHWCILPSYLLQCRLRSCFIRLFNFWKWRMYLISKKLRFISFPQLVLVESSRDLSFIDLFNPFLKLSKLVMLLWSHYILINSIGWLWTLWQMDIKMRNSWHRELSKYVISVLWGNGILIFLFILLKIRVAGYAKGMGCACINPK